MTEEEDDKEAEDDDDTTINLSNSFFNFLIFSANRPPPIATSAIFHVIPSVARGFCDTKLFSQAKNKNNNGLVHIVCGPSATAWQCCNAGVFSRLNIYLDQRQGNFWLTINLCMDKSVTFDPFLALILFCFICAT